MTLDLFRKNQHSGLNGVHEQHDTAVFIGRIVLTLQLTGKVKHDWQSLVMLLLPVIVIWRSNTPLTEIIFKKRGAKFLEIGNQSIEIIEEPDIAFIPEIHVREDHLFFCSDAHAGRGFSTSRWTCAIRRIDCGKTGNDLKRVDIDEAIPGFVEDVSLCWRPIHTITIPNLGIGF